MKPVVLALCAAVLGLFAPAIAYAAPAAPKTENTSAPPTVQLKHILAPALTKPGTTTTSLLPMTPILVVPQASNLPLVCQRAPRVAEALLRYFMKKPAPVTKKYGLDDKALAEQKRMLAAYVNRAIGLKAISAVHIIGDNKPQTKGVAARLSFAHAISCGPVLAEYEKRIREMLQE